MLLQGLVIEMWDHELKCVRRNDLVQRREDVGEGLHGGEGVTRHVLNNMCKIDRPNVNSINK